MVREGNCLNHAGDKMANVTKATIEANGLQIAVKTNNGQDYFCLTDIARHKNPDEPSIVVCNWMRLHNTIQYLGLWEKLHNPHFKPIEFDRFLREAGTNAFTLSPLGNRLNRDCIQF